MHTENQSVHSGQLLRVRNFSGSELFYVATRDTSEKTIPITLSNQKRVDCYSLGRDTLWIRKFIRWDILCVCRVACRCTHKGTPNSIIFFVQYASRCATGGGSNDKQLVLSPITDHYARRYFMTIFVIIITIIMTL